MSRHRTAAGNLPSGRRTVKPSPGVRPVSQLLLGIAILVGWAAITFGLHPQTGWIHLGLIVGVLLVIRGIVLRDATAPPR